MSVVDVDAADYFLHTDAVPEVRRRQWLLAWEQVGPGLIALATTYIIVTALSAFVVSVEHTSTAAAFLVASISPESPPYLCYEFSASLHRRTVFKHVLPPGEQESTRVDSTSTVGVQVSRSADVVALVEPASPPFEKTLREFVSIDRSWPDQNQSSGANCVRGSLEPFFDEIICELLPGGERVRQEGGGCSMRALRHIMPLDGSYGASASRVYTNATRASSQGDRVGHTSSGDEIWEWRSVPQTLHIRDGGRLFRAHADAHMLYHIAPVGENSATASPYPHACSSSMPSPEAHKSTDPQRIAQLLNVRSIVNITLVCTEGGKACALAPRQMIYTGETTFGNILPHDVSPGSTRRHPSAIGSLPPLRERCVDMRVLEGDVPVGRISEATESTVDSETSLLLADRGGGLGELNEVSSWRAPTAEHLIRTVGGDPFLIATINSHKDLGWEAGEAQYLKGAPLVQLQHTLGLKGLHSLPVNGMTMGSRKARQDRHGRRRALESVDLDGEPLPVHFDARERWPECAEQIGRIQNQGACGSCWAQAAVATLADRLCIATHGAFGARLSAQAMIDCDAHNDGCGGGYLDNAWRYLVRVGVPTEDCVPYTYCDNPALPNCSSPADGPPIGVPWPPLPPPSTPPAPPESHNPHCNAKELEKRCADGSPMRVVHKAVSGYAAARVGDAIGLQRELLRHGPVEVGLLVYLDFMHYAKGIYRRSPLATHPLGGHAVRLIGWGEMLNETTNESIPYWLAANSWSTAWGEQGFFRIRRGTNELEIETKPAAGLPSVL